MVVMAILLATAPSLARAWVLASTAVRKGGSTQVISDFLYSR